MKYYKFTGKNGTATNGGGYQWPLPTKNADGTWTPGKWTKKLTGDLELCERGYHYTDETGVSGWIDAELYEIEIDGQSIMSDDKPVKYACRRARLLRRIEQWDERTGRLFAVWCAREAMKLIDNPDPRSIAAIDTAERFANGQATREELDAAWAAAWDAARAATRAAAWAAARDAARDAAWDAARDAARDAAWAAARDAARDAAWDAAWAAQSKRLLEMVGESPTKG